MTSCAIVILSAVDLPGIKLDWYLPVSLAIKGFNLLANTLDIILPKTLHKEIGLN